MPRDPILAALLVGALMLSTARPLAARQSAAAETGPETAAEPRREDGSSPRWITEAGLAIGPEARSRWYPSFEVARTWPVAAGLALGVGGFVGHEREPVAGIKPRLELGVGPADLHLAAGPVCCGVVGERWFLSTHAGIGVRGRWTALVQVERRADAHGGSHDYPVHLGARVGSTAGALLGAAGVLVGIVWWAVTGDG